MVGQCLFCSWYGIRLRRAPYLDGRRPLYHMHCARVALQSPDPVDRARAEQIFRAELPRVMRSRFWEVNPPNRTVSPVAAVRDLSEQEFDRLCRERLSGTGELLSDFLPDAAPPSLPTPGSYSGGRRLDEGGRVRQRSLPPAPAARRSGRVAPAARFATPRRNAAEAPANQAIEAVTSLSGEELSLLRARLAARQAAAEVGAMEVIEPVAEE
jgi:hypothetical protein